MVSLIPVERITEGSQDERGNWRGCECYATEIIRQCNVLIQGSEAYMTSCVIRIHRDKDITHSHTHGHARTQARTHTHTQIHTHTHTGAGVCTPTHTSTATAWRGKQRTQTWQQRLE